MSSSKRWTKNDPGSTASVRLLLISDLPPPDTVHGLWQKAPSGTVPTSRQLGAAINDMKSADEILSELAEGAVNTQAAQG